MNRRILIAVLMIAIGAGGGVLYQRWQAGQTATPASATASAAQAPAERPKANERRPDFTLPDVEGKPRSIGEWDGKVIVLNFWATWCPPCVREIPALQQLYETYQDKGLVVVGVALDTTQSVIDFIDPQGVEYPVLIADQEGPALTSQYGNRLNVLPYTVVIDRQGNIVYRHRSEITFEEAEKVIRPLL